MHRPGARDVLQYEEIHLPPPQPHEVRLRHRAIGVNFIDTYYRSGLYAWPHSPLIPGAEGSGEVISTGQDVTWLKPGDRVAYTVQTGAYAEERNISADRLVQLPPEISDETAAAMMLKGLTVQYLMRQIFQIKSGDIVLFHAASGGVGLIAGQWGAHLGALMIGTVGSDDKIELARANGYSHVINYSRENFVTRVAKITNGKGVDVVYDSIGQNTYPQSLDCLKKRGLWVSFGQSSGIVKNFELAHLASKGSLVATRPVLFDFIDTRESLNSAAAELFSVVESGKVRISINQRFALKEAAQAHEKLESRLTTASTILYP